MKQPQQRLPRFTRDADAAGSFQFTKRDLEILRHVAEHRFIRSNWLINLVGGSHQQLLRRLNLLYHHGYLERPRCQIDYYHKGGSKNLVYGLASRGAGRLRHDLDMPFSRMEWTTRNRRIGRLFLEHTLMVSDFMAALELECRARVDVRLFYGSELPKPKGREQSRAPFRWTVDLPGKRSVSVVPDKVFAINTTRTDGKVTRIHYFLEADRGTMPVIRKSTQKSSIYVKLKSYLVLHTSDLNFISRPNSKVCVLILVDSVPRQKNIRTIIHKLTRGRAFILMRCKADSSIRDSILSN